MKRAAVIGVLALLCVGAAAAVFVVRRLEAGRDIHGSASVEFTTTATTAPPQRASPVPWPMFGHDASRQGVFEGGRIRPPYRGRWVAGGRSLIEFPPAIAYDHLYYGDGGGRVYAISTLTGERDWRFDSHRSLAATPAIGPYAHGTVYETFLNRLGSPRKVADDGEVVALAAGTGGVRWRVHIGASETSPLLARGLLYVGGWNGTIYALDPRTGRTRWTFRTGAAVKGGLATDGTRVYAGSYDGHVYALDAATGRLVWRTAGQQGLRGLGSFYSTPAVAYGRVYIGCTDGRVYSFGARSGVLRWSHRTGGYVYGSPAVWDGIVLVGSYDHHFYGFDAATGDVRWRFDAGGTVSGSATVIDAIVYFATRSGTTYALAARDGRLLWSFRHGDYAPAVSDGERLYVVGSVALYGVRPSRR